MKAPKRAGFTTVELLVTLFVAAVFLTSGYQLYSLIIKDGGDTRAQARAENVAYDYLKRYESYVTNPCTTSTPVNATAITVANLSKVTVTVTITCPYTANTSISKIAASITYNEGLTLAEATYINAQ